MIDAQHSTEAKHYDPVGNRLTQNSSGTATTYVYDNANRLSTETTGAELTTYTYDATGNREKKDVAGGSITFYEWDSQNLMTQIDAGGNQTDFTYNADRQRVTKTGPDRTFIYDGSKIVEEFDPASSDATHYTSSLQDEYGDLVSQYKQDGANTDSYFYQFDALGSTNELTDELAAVKNQYTYSAFGKKEAETGTVENNFTYVGKQGYFDDSPVNLYLLSQRYLDPETGQFISKDPIGIEAGDVNYYRYVFNNPINDIDPEGMKIKVNIGTQFEKKKLILNEASKVTQDKVVNKVNGWKVFGPAIREGQTIAAQTNAIAGLAFRLRYTCTCKTLDKKFYAKPIGLDFYMYIYIENRDNIWNFKSNKAKYGIIEHERQHLKRIVYTIKRYNSSLSTMFDNMINKEGYKNKDACRKAVNREWAKKARIISNVITTVAAGHPTKTHSGGTPRAPVNPAPNAGKPKVIPMIFNGKFSQVPPGLKNIEYLDNNEIATKWFNYSYLTMKNFRIKSEGKLPPMRLPIKKDSDIDKLIKKELLEGSGMFMSRKVLEAIRKNKKYNPPN